MIAFFRFAAGTQATQGGSSVRPLSVPLWIFLLYVVFHEMNGSCALLRSGTVEKQMRWSRHCQHRLSSMNSDSSGQSVAIVGGGLAGLSTAFHMLSLCPSSNITIFDKTAPGTGGASSVAGGLLHPLSPKGKLVYLGLEGVETTNALVAAAAQEEHGVVLTDDLYRIAMTDEQLQTLSTTGDNLPNIAQWVPPENLPTLCDTDAKGALRLHSGCRVIHIPTYLKGLWKACQNRGSGKLVWNADAQCGSSKYPWERKLSPFDVVVFSAGAGLFQDKMVSDELPIQIVRGQSVELAVSNKFETALLCGKYVCPTVAPGVVLVGATHEFKSIPLEPHQVELELKSKTDPFVSRIWQDGKVQRVTCGYRVQSNRGSHGRLPIIGKLSSTFHENSWIFTGLSSRGLLYHGVYGKILVDMMLGRGSSVGETDVNN